VRLVVTVRDGVCGHREKFRAILESTPTKRKGRGDSNLGRAREAVKPTQSRGRVTERMYAWSALASQDLRDPRRERRRTEWLADEVKAASGLPARRQAGVRMARHEQDPQMGIPGTEAVYELDTCHSRHHHVGQDQVDRARRSRSQQRLIGRGCCVPGLSECDRLRLFDGSLVGG
jgi:hypothetical protein